jgi:hypothetical protein
VGYRGYADHQSIGMTRSQTVRDSDDLLCRRGLLYSNAPPSDLISAMVELCSCASERDNGAGEYVRGQVDRTKCGSRLPLLACQFT